MKPLASVPVLIAALASVSFSPGVGAVQSTDAGEPLRVQAPAVSGPPDALAAADRLFDEGRALDALDLLEAYLGRRPGDYEARWRAARAAVALGIMAEDEPTEERWLEYGIAHAREAVAAPADDGVDGLYWLVVSRGWLAMVVGNPVRIADLADDVLADVTRLLEMEPAHPGGHHALGKLHYEIMTLSAFERFLARHLLGVDVARVSSWSASTDHLERAVALQPEAVLYRLDLGMTYLRAGHPEAARTELATALELPLAFPADPVFKRRARALLDELGPSPGTPGSGGR